MPPQMYGGRLQVPNAQPLHHSHGLEACSERRSMLWFYGQLGHVTRPQILCFMGCLHIPGEKWFTFWALSTLLNQLPGSCSWRRKRSVCQWAPGGQGKNREAGQRRAGEGPPQGPSVSCLWHLEPISESVGGAVQGLSGEDPEGLHMHNYSRCAGLSLHVAAWYTLAHGVPITALRGWN